MVPRLSRDGGLRQVSAFGAGFGRAEVALAARPPLRHVLRSAALRLCPLPRRSVSGSTWHSYRGAAEGRNGPRGVRT